MGILPTTLGTRPRLAVEIRPACVVAARAEDAAALLTAVSRADLAEGALVPGLKAANVVDKAAVTAAVRKALDGVAGTGRERSRNVTVVVPDSSVRVMFLDFDQLPSKVAEALPVVRFRLKKLLPFDTDDAAVSYQIMSNEKGGLIKMLVAAIPKAVLEEYESVVIAAGYVPGAVLPSTLAALAGLEETEVPALVVNGGPESVTTAIVKAGVLLLHRSVDMGGDISTSGGEDLMAAIPAMSLVDRENSAQEWAQQEALGPGGWERFEAEAAMQSEVLQSTVNRESASAGAAREAMQAVSVAVAYYEDTLQIAPETVLTAGVLSAETMAAMMGESGFEGLRVQEMVDAGMMEAGGVNSTVPRGWLAGVRGALKN
jgi:type IV pilus assembly protein PilM